MVKVAIGLFDLHKWFGGDIAAVGQAVRLAEDKGIDQVFIGDHLAMGAVRDAYPFGEFTPPLDYPWYEPITIMAAVAGATSRIRLSTSILISPLRPAILLAKQLATLDALSRGRVDAGLGVGWQRLEYDAVGVPFDNRGAILEEQIRACRALWRSAPASFHGTHVAFEGVYSYPRPVQSGGIPIWLGCAPTRRWIARLAEWCEGWIPLGLSPAEIGCAVSEIRAAMVARGRDPSTLAIRTMLPPVRGADGLGDLDATLAQAPALCTAGATHLEIYPTMYCRDEGGFEAFLDRLAAWKDTA
ncbi:MAG: fmn-dependent monooxygenase [Rhodospirillales bacterium]|nr:fmn-dependent monooxygenase [Rhodospirillales bacterium]